MKSLASLGLLGSVSAVHIFLLWVILLNTGNMSRSSVAHFRCSYFNLMGQKKRFSWP